MSDDLDIRTLYRAWAALAQGDVAILEQSLAPNARWLGVEDGQLCEGREAIIDVIGRSVAGGLRGRIEETIQDGPGVIVAFRPERPAGLDRPLDDGIAYLVVTIRDGQITELKGCAGRDAAVAYARNRRD